MSLKEVHAFPPLPLVHTQVKWRQSAYVMAGVRAAILGHEMETMFQWWKNNREGAWVSDDHEAALWAPYAQAACDMREKENPIML